MDKISETKKLLKTVRENIEKIAETKVKKEKREVTEIKKEIMQYHDSIMEKIEIFESNELWLEEVIERLKLILEDTEVLI
ncbi:MULTISPECIES: hypothetical protein [Fusobacterium]|jgi:hypothetical protein|uniref:hypothetical protein n=1 Tax=Fusobacterium TaxID=848 RepID=UPI000E4CC3E9|nr:MULTISPECIES: hypothetical protein [Fusobacterium]MCB8563996.1 hypothetical protein [Fusobacterium ulcerans]MCB8648163.1 hypothetical protein [Fusobacterium ulcerans]MDH6457002.1 hypothetical protein [Fusobacterium sp. PH5-7]MEE0139893.1 hypothetical protein [Fusobacterium ulcerans]RGY64578.1 hypothetical protein DXA30_08400 [Fusobacterium ulcerans]